MASMTWQSIVPARAVSWRWRQRQLCEPQRQTDKAGSVLALCASFLFSHTSPTERRCCRCEPQASPGKQLCLSFDGRERFPPCSTGCPKLAACRILRVPKCQAEYPCGKGRTCKGSVGRLVFQRSFSVVLFGLTPLTNAHFGLTRLMVNWSYPGRRSMILA